VKDAAGKCRRVAAERAASQGEADAARAGTVVDGSSRLTGRVAAQGALTEANDRAAAAAVIENTAADIVTVGNVAADGTPGGRNRPAALVTEIPDCTPIIRRRVIAYGAVLQKKNRTAERAVIEDRPAGPKSRQPLSLTPPFSDWLARRNPLSRRYARSPESADHLSRSRPA